MAINNMQEKFQDGLGDIYDAEHQFLKAMEEMLQNASDTNLQQMLSTHIEQTKGHIKNLEQVFQVLGTQPQRVMCDGAKGIVSEGQKGIKDTSSVPAICDTAIAGAADKAEHYEIASYRGLIGDAELMGQREIVGLLQQNLEQEESTSQLIEQSMPALLQNAMSGGGTQPSSYSQASPTY